MRRLLLVVLMLGIAGSAMAANFGTQAEFKPLGAPYVPPAEPRQGGENLGSAYVIPSLPFSDAGTTTGYIQDYFASCGANAAPDVVYTWVATASGTLTVDLCGSSYDTVVHVHENAIGNEIGCNDDFCGLQSTLSGLAVTSGNTYIIIVSGYSSANGAYTIAVSMPPPPQPFDCPAGALHENEPACQDNYQDHYNGGCNSTPQIWQVVDGQAVGCAIFCGYSCTYLNGGASTRDTDWFLSVGTGATVTLTSVAEFALQSILISGTNCSNLVYVLGSSAPNVPNTISTFIANGAAVWEWEGPQVFAGVPNLQYKFEICGIRDGVPVPTETTSWGSLKNQYK